MHRLWGPTLFLLMLTACDPHYRTWSPPPGGVGPVQPQARFAPAPKSATTVPRPAAGGSAVPPAARPSATIAASASQAAAQPRPRSLYAPTAAEVESAAIGPFPANYEQIVRGYLKPRLYFPEEARYRFAREPRRAYRPGYTRQQTLFAWSVGAYVNAKNAQGQFTGEDFHLFYVVNGRVLAHSNVDAELRRYTTGR